MGVFAESAISSGLDLSAITDALKGVATPGDIILIVAAGIGVCAGFVLAWMAVRKLSGMIQRAIAKGRISA